MIRLTVFTVLFAVLNQAEVTAQEFYFGADLSYVNEMNDCGVEYTVNGEVQEAYTIFEENNCNLVRIRTWHTPSWYDDMNDGNRYSDLDDVKRSIGRAKNAGMQVLLDFHLSDDWADPSKQVVPAAWAPVVDNVDILKDSLYNYLYSSLEQLHSEGLLPEMVQIGNETNKGILQSQEQNDAGWALDWERNAVLFNEGIRAVRDLSEEVGEDIRIVIHAAGPEDAEWIFREFVENGVTDFDIMGISYYWAWHRPTDIEGAGAVVNHLKTTYPQYDVMIVETGYIWTWDSNDQAGNIIGEVHPDYSPPSPDAQRDWLIDMTQEVMDNGASGVIYWEPAWVSSPCWTQWGQGSHQEHATFFDFDNELMGDGGIAWMRHDYALTSGAADMAETPVEMWVDTNSNMLWVQMGEFRTTKRMEIQLHNTAGQLVHSEPCFLIDGRAQVDVAEIPTGVYAVVLSEKGELVSSQQVYIH